MHLNLITECVLLHGSIYPHLFSIIWKLVDYCDTTIKDLSYTSSVLWDRECLLIADQVSPVINDLILGQLPEQVISLRIDREVSVVYILHYFESYEVKMSESETCSLKLNEITLSYHLLSHGVKPID